MLARRAAAEIVAGDQDGGVAPCGLVEHEFRILRAVLIVARFGEQALAKTGPLDGLEVVLRDDHVGVDIDDRKGGGDAGEAGEFFHGLRVLSVCAAAFNKQSAEKEGAGCDFATRTTFSAAGLRDYMSMMVPRPSFQTLYSPLVLSRGCAVDALAMA